MAKKSKIQKNLRRIEISQAAKARRDELRAKAKQGDQEAVIALSKMRRDTSPSRVRNRDAIDGRPRGYMKKFGISRINFREKAHKGEIPGVKKASW